MADSEVPVGPKWGPGLIGTIVGLALYGVSIFQCAVLFVFLLDTINTIGLLSFYYRTLISCRWQTTYTCTLEMPWDLSTVIVTSVISGLVLRAMFLCPQSLDNWRSEHVIDRCSACRCAGTTDLWVRSQYAPINALGSAICDMIITTIFVQMGLITSIRSVLLHAISSSAVTLAILYFQDQPTAQYLTAAPGFMLSKAYSNSMLAVLNARKLIYDQQQALSLELPTLSSIH
ncbi:hypothetical protein EV401DRAFT_346166 [Pisolithus croceorrhizus]|nr:hypothetical protein EV401DRAFT_346166 [Pisolithus croceorrhizus]